MTRFLRCLIKVGALPFGVFSRRLAAGVHFLVYHQSGGHLPLDIDLPKPLLRRQLEFLCRTGRVVTYERALALLQSDKALSEDLFVLTFDDAYKEFHTHVFPLLKELDLPAILFVPTGFVEGEIVSPLTQIHLHVQPVTWGMLGEMQASGLVTLGAHTHSHLRLVHETSDRVVEELGRPIHLFEERLGLDVKHFAYPGALWDERTERLVKQYYDSAVVGGGQKATAAGYTPYRIPRVPVRASDGWSFFRAKVRGWLAAEERLYAILHRLARVYGRGDAGSTGSPATPS